MAGAVTSLDMSDNGSSCLCLHFYAGISYLTIKLVLRKQTRFPRLPEYAPYHTKSSNIRDREIITWNHILIFNIIIRHSQSSYFARAQPPQFRVSVVPPIFVEDSNTKVLHDQLGREDSFWPVSRCPKFRGAGQTSAKLLRLVQDGREEEDLLHLQFPRKRLEGEQAGERLLNVSLSLFLCIVRAYCINSCRSRLCTLANQINTFL